MKNRINRSAKQALSFVGTLLLCSFIQTAGAIDQPAQPRPDVEDAGFTRSIQHLQMGSKTVLFFESESTIGRTKFGVAADLADENIEMLNKFLKWAEIAKSRGDVLNKEIGLVKGFDFGAFYYWNRYEFQTVKSNDTFYMLCIQPGTKLLGIKFNPKSYGNDSQAFGPMDFKTYFTENQVRMMIARIQEFKDGKLKAKEEVEMNYK